MQFSARVRWLMSLVVLPVIVASCSASVSNESAQQPSTTTVASAGPAKSGDATVGLSAEQKSHVVDNADTTWDVELSDNTTLVEGDALAAVDSADDDGTLVFDKSAADAANLDLSKGRVLLVANTALGRITGVSSGGSKVTVKTEPASLADAIENGTVAWDVPLDYDFDQFVTGSDSSAGKGGKVEPNAYSGPGEGAHLRSISMAMPDGRVVPVIADRSSGRSMAADDPPVDIKVKPDDGAVEWTVNSGGNKYQFRITAKGDTAEFLVVVSRSSGGKPKMAYRGEGTLGAMRSQSDSRFSGGKASSSELNLDDLDAKLKLSASVAGAGVSPVDLKVPVPMLTYVVPVGPIPVTVEVKANIIGSVKATAKASATAEASFSYSGSAGFSFDGTDISASGNTDNDKMDPEPADSAAPMGVDVDAQFGVAFPEVSLSIFGQGLVPSIHYGAVVGSNLHWGPPKAGFAASTICKSAYVRAEVVGEYDLKFLDVTLGHGEHEFWKDRKDAKNESEGCKQKEQAEAGAGSE